MTNAHIAAGWLRQADYILQEARQQFKAGLWHLTVRRCQESVELALKALLGFYGIAVPHLHDVGFLLKEHETRFSRTIRKRVETLQSISRRLRHERETSFYGDEEMSLAPDEIYNAGDATAALRDARTVLELITRETHHVKS